MKIVFLDIDGVLATTNTRFQYFDLDCVLVLEAILRQVPDSKIVVTSTWRLGCKSLKDLKNMMRWGSVRKPTEFHGISVNFIDRIIGATSRIFSYDELFKCNQEVPRGQEITAWLKDYPEVDGYLVLDDDTDIQPHQERFVRTDIYKGIQAKDIEKCIEILRKPWENCFCEDDF